jgi:hypothetical protein
VIAAIRTSMCLRVNAPLLFGSAPLVRDRIIIFGAHLIVEVVSEGGRPRWRRMNNAPAEYPRLRGSYFATRHALRPILTPIA